MKKYSKLVIIALMAIFSVVSLSSCDFINRALSKLGLGGNPETTTTSGDPTAPIQSTTIVDDRSSSVITPSTSQSKTTTKNSTTTNTSKTKTTTTTTTPTTPRTSASTTPTTGMSTQASSSSSRTTTTTTTASSTAASTEYALDYGYNDLARYSNGAKYQELYIQFKDFLDDFYTSSSDIPMQLLRGTSLVSISSEAEAEDGETIYCLIGDVDYTKYGIEAKEALSVFKSVLLDNPQYYFIANSVLMFESGGTKTIKVSIDTDYRLGSTRLKYNTSIANYLRTFDLFMPTGLTDKEKVRFVHDFIKDNASYAYKSDGKTPSDSKNAHNILGIITEKKGVCESYTELFTYVLKYLNIPAITVTGMGYTKTSPTGESHAWNYVMLDGKYYGFDVTWNDSVGRDYYYGLSYAKIDNIARFDSGAAVFIDSSIGGHKYTESSLTYGFEYLYRIPSCSTTDLA